MSAYREEICRNLTLIKDRLNLALSGQNLRRMKPILKRIDSSGSLPAWFEQLATKHTLPNLDGKTIGSVIEKLLVCILESDVLGSRLRLSINPAKGVDIPELELGVKSPSENFCTSEPYFSAYERLIGNENDALILLTDYQSSKKKTSQNRGLRLQIKDVRYLKGSEIADRHLCEIAECLKNEFLVGNIDECMLKRAIHFLAYVNQGDWEASCIVDLMRNIIMEHKSPQDEISRITEDFQRLNAKYERESKPAIDRDSLDRIVRAANSQSGIIIEAENWVTRNLNENWHSPSAAVWNRIKSKPLEGKIGMSFALQWRYNFGPVFKN